jgi:hypothetical protein
LHGKEVKVFAIAKILDVNRLAVRSFIEILKLGNKDTSSWIFQL